MTTVKLTPRGKIAQPIELFEVRPLVREDLKALEEARKPAPMVQKLRDPHHRLARLLAAGVRPRSKVAERSGYSLSRIAILEADPSFQQLVAHYREIVTREFVESIDDYAELSISNMLKAERQIAEHFDTADENNELLPLKTLVAISADKADRFGYGKESRSTNTNINVDFAAKLEATIRRTAKVINLPSAASQLPEPVGTPSADDPPVAVASPLRRRF